jgi:hypothetical protein
MWTKLGDEFGDATWNLSDAAFRTHVEALMWVQQARAGPDDPQAALPQVHLQPRR